ncbi:hypothetical protein FC96_GL002238 [Secundilactobacillus kimchicus JCM 15530]|uniref:Permuted papain-like amidase enzyme, YaeF/YiiX, C92 family n=1 Tax=Secundilactobacillus kimchicus JCM 15530 TaxID=1302272 RepID=A0A0R1HMW1_9LACO|nr:hypothetical protein [Secundilactobacillus kimchicus]KRK47752.1 hypothetical protein FC96_GL002238 [Secundilactobacillus kimchicus JCM 15530]
MKKQLLFGLAIVLTILTGTVSAHATSATKGYKMQAGDLLVAHGANANSLGGVGGMFGHVAIATTANYVIEMPGENYGYSLKQNAHVTPKKTLFARHASPVAGSWVDVYRLPKAKQKAAKQAALYAYRDMYKKNNPNYAILPAGTLYQSNPSYCSKFIYLAFYNLFGTRAVKQFNTALHFVSPYGLNSTFTTAYKPQFLSKITAV